MFVARGVIVCLAFFAVMYASLSCAIGSAWFAGRRLRLTQAPASPGVLFGIRIFPFAASVFVAVFLTFPSFWIMERKSLDEDLTTFFLAAVAAVVLSAGLARAIKATRLTRRAIARWSRESGIGREANAPALNAAAGAPALMLVGVCRPKVMVSDMAAAVLSESELRVAVRHELAHKRSWDNFKKVLINLTPFPGLHGIEHAWREAAELAADQSAVATRQDALDLATALIKLSRSAKQWNEPEIASALVCGSSAVATRVHRLLEWRSGPRLRRAWPWALLSVLIVTAVVSNYGTALAMTHRLTELLVP